MIAAKVERFVPTALHFRSYPRTSSSGAAAVFKGANEALMVASVPHRLSLLFGCGLSTNSGRSRPDGRVLAVPNRISTP